MVWCRPIARAASVSAPDPAASPAERSLSLPDSSGQHYAAVVALPNDAITVDTQPRIPAAPEAAVHQRALIFMGARSGASGVSGPWPIGAKMTLLTTMSQPLGSLPDRDLAGASVAAHQRLRHSSPSWHEADLPGGY